MRDGQLSRQLDRILLKCWGKLLPPKVRAFFPEEKRSDSEGEGGNYLLIYMMSDKMMGGCYRRTRFHRFFLEQVGRDGRVAT